MPRNKDSKQQYMSSTGMDISADKNNDNENSIENTQEINKIVGELIQEEKDILNGVKPVNKSEVSFETGEIRDIIKQDLKGKKIDNDSKDKHMIDCIIDEVIAQSSKKNDPEDKAENSISMNNDEAESLDVDGKDDFVKKSNEQFDNKLDTQEQLMFADIFDKVKQERLIKKREEDKRKALVKDKSDEAKNRIKQILAYTDTIEFKALAAEQEKRAKESNINNKVNIENESINQMSNSVEEPKVQETVEQEVKPMEKPKVQETVEQEIKPVEEPKVQETVEQEIKPVEEPKVQETVEQEVKPMEEPKVQETAEQEVKPMEEPKVQETAEQEVKPMEEPKVQETAEQEVKPVEDSKVQETAEQEVKPMEKPKIQETAEQEIKPVEEPKVDSNVNNSDEFMFIENYDGDFPEFSGEIEHDDLDIGLEIVNSKEPYKVENGVIEQRTISVDQLRQIATETNNGQAHLQRVSTEVNLKSSDEIKDEKKSNNDRALEQAKTNKVKSQTTSKNTVTNINQNEKNEEKTLSKEISDKARSQVKNIMTKAVSVMESKSETVPEVAKEDDFEDKWNEDWNEETQEVLLSATMQFDKIKSLIDKEKKSSVLNRKASTFEELDREAEQHAHDLYHAPSIKKAIDVGIDVSTGNNISEATKNDLLKSGRKINIFESNFMEIDFPQPKEEKDDIKDDNTQGKTPIEDNTDSENKSERTENAVSKEKSESVVTETEEVEKESVQNNFDKKTREKFVQELKKNSTLYAREISQNQIKVITGNFTDVLRSECIQSAKITGIAGKTMPKVVDSTEKSKPIETELEQNDSSVVVESKKNKILKIVIKAIKENILEEQSADNIKSTSKGVIDDYSDKKDASDIRKELVLNQRRLLIRTGATAILMLFSLILALIYRLNIPGISAVLKSNSLTYILINFALLITGAVICKNTLKNGLASILRWKGTSDTAVSFLVFVCAIQCFIAMFFSSEFISGGLVIYVLLALLGLFFNSWGKLTVIHRIFDNFKFISSDKEKYSAKIYTDEANAEEMFKGVGSYRPVIAYQKKTEILSDFLKLSYDEDPSEKFAGKVSLAGIILSILIGIGYGLITRDVAGGITAITLTAVLSCPIACILAVNKPINNLCKKANELDSMLVGYPAVQQFCDTNAVIISAKELYPKACVEFHGIKGFNTYAVDKAILEAASVIIQSESPLSPIFKDFVKDNFRILPVVEKMNYEDDRGIEAWVKGRRILIGNRIIMENHGIAPPSRDEEMEYTKGGKQITYIAASNELLAMVITSYKPSDTMIKEMQRLEDNGISFLITTEDPNITPKLISEHFRVFFRSVKILPREVSKKFTENERKTERKTRAYLSTGGKLTSFARMLSACVRVRSNVTAAVVTQSVSIVLGLLIALLLTFSAGIQHLNVIEMFIYCIFWILATLAVPYIRKP